MIKYNLNNINDWDFNESDITKVYRNNAVVYQKLTTGGTPPSSGLPSGYTEVEYVENTGTSYINTNFVPNQDTRILCTMQCVTSTNSTLHLGAGGWDKTTGMWLTYERGITGTLHISWGNSTTWAIYNNVHGDYDVHTYDWNKNQFYRDETLIGSVTYTQFTCSDNLGIFATIQNGASPTDVIFKGKLYSFKIYDNDTLVRDFIPCTRDSDSTAGVYDIVNDAFYSSARSGVELVAGPTIN